MYWQTSIILTNLGKTGFLWTGKTGTSGNTSGTITWVKAPAAGSVLTPALSSITTSAPSSFLSPPSPSSLPLPLAPSEDWPLLRNDPVLKIIYNTTNFKLMGISWQKLLRSSVHLSEESRSFCQNMSVKIIVWKYFLWLSLYLQYLVNVVLLF